MNMQFPPAIRSKLDAVLASGYYHTEEEVVINVLVSLEQDNVASASDSAGS